MIFYLQQFDLSRGAPQGCSWLGCSQCWWLLATELSRREPSKSLRVGTSNKKKSLCPLCTLLLAGPPHLSPCLHNYLFLNMPHVFLGAFLFMTRPCNLWLCPSISDHASPFLTFPLHLWPCQPSISYPILPISDHVPCPSPCPLSMRSAWTPGSRCAPK